MLLRNNRTDPPELYGKVVEVLGTGIHSWHSLEPTPEKADGCMYLPKFQNTLPCGSFVILRDVNIIGRIISCSYGHIRVNLFRMVHECDQTRYFGFDYSQRPPRCTDMNLRNIKELFQTNELATVEPDDIEDIAFVFKRNAIIELPFHSQGISNLFMLRIRISGVAIPAGQCLPFHSSYDNLDTAHSIECYPRLIWKHIEEVRVHLMKGLCRTGQRQGLGLIRAYESMLCSPYFIKYLEVRMTTTTKWVAIPERKLKRRKVEAALSRRTVSEVLTGCKLVRFESESQLQLFCDLFGETSIVGCRKRFPKSGADKLVLKQNDALNVINGIMDEEVDDAFQLSSNIPGIDLIFDGKKIYARVRYRTYIYNRCDLEEDPDTAPITPAIVAIISAPIDKDLEAPMYAGPRVCSTFSRGEIVYEVEEISIENSVAVCVNVDDYRDRREYTVAEVSGFLAEDRA